MCIRDRVAGFNPVALALPASFMICDTITLPPHSKVNLTYYSTGKFTVLEEMTDVYKRQTYCCSYWGCCWIQLFYSWYCCLSYVR